MLFPPRYLPCVECGASVEIEASAAHRCEGERLLDYAMFRLRAGVSAVEADLRAWLACPPGRFEEWLAARQVKDSTQT